MICRLIILLLIVGGEEKDVYGCIDSNAVNFLPNATVSDNSCEYSIYGYPDFATICGMDEYANPTENIGDGICELCIGQIETESGNYGIFIPMSQSVSLPYPNPFHSITSITLAVPSDTYLTIYILNRDYNTIDTLISRQLDAGVYSIVWDASLFPSGYYRIVADFGDEECFTNVYKLLDCAGIVGGDAVEDECGECGGNGADEGEVALWGECYSIEATTDLDLRWVGIWYYGYRTIPPEIGSLTNLTTLNLSHNQLTALPEEICDIYSNLSEFDVSDNHICGELPSCLTAEDIGEQNCD